MKAHEDNKQCSVCKANYHKKNTNTEKLDKRYGVK